MKRLVLIVSVLLLGHAINSYASTVIATETSRAEYENGKLTYSAVEDINNQFTGK